MHPEAVLFLRTVRMLARLADPVLRLGGTDSRQSGRQSSDPRLNLVADLPDVVEGLSFEVINVPEWRLCVSGVGPPQPAPRRERLGVAVEKANSPTRANQWMGASLKTKTRGTNSG